MRKYGPKHEIIGEALIRLGDGFSYIHEILSCGHYVLTKTDGEGLYAVKSRCCKQCRDRKPVISPGKIINVTRF
jgi:hypothetical protein